MARRRGGPTPPPIPSFWQRYRWFIFGGIGLFFIISVIAPALGNPPETEEEEGTTDPTDGAPQLLVGELYFQAVAIDSREHIPVGQAARSYSSNPPTSGPHWNAVGIAPTPWGLKADVIPDEALVHNLEHGGIVIHYQTTAPQNLIDQLTSFVQSQANFPNGYVLAPREALPATITLSAWEYYLPLFQFNEQQMRAFVSAHYDQGPETLDGQLK